MELAQLRYLRTVVRTGSVTAAARAEHVSQPSVSKVLRQLELELGTQLFHRVGRRVVPTDAAVELADCADRILDDLASTTAAIGGPAGTGSGSLRICATETVSNHLLPRALSRLAVEHRRARIRVEMLGTDDAIGRVLADEVDFAIVALPVSDSRLEVEELLDEEVLCALPLSHRWSGLHAIPLDDVLRAPELLLSMPGHGLRSVLEARAHELGIQVEARIEMRSQQALLAMVAAGGGITVAPRIAVPIREGVAVRPLVPEVRRQVGWVRRRGRHIGAVGQRLIALVAESVGRG